MMHDLFGQPAVPWGMLERERLPSDSFTLISRPIPDQLADALADGEDHDLAGLLSLGRRGPSTVSSHAVVFAGINVSRVNEIVSTRALLEAKQEASAVGYSYM